MMRPIEKELNDPAWWDENAPEGATHWVGPAAHPWERHEQGKRIVWRGGRWGVIAEDNLEGYELCIPRPTQPQWADQGDWIPPVGSLVKYPSGFGVVKLDADKEGVLIVEEDGSYKRVHKDSCRPHRTQAEIEREEVVKAGISILESDPDAADDSWIKLCERLYDAGMLRKPMSREEGDKRLYSMGIGLTAQQRTDILDALGYKEPTK